MLRKLANTYQVHNTLTVKQLRPYYCLLVILLQCLCQWSLKFDISKMNSLGFHNCFAPLSLHTGNAEYADSHPKFHKLFLTHARIQSASSRFLFTPLNLPLHLYSLNFSYSSQHFFPDLMQIFLPVLPSTGSSLI